MTGYVENSQSAAKECVTHVINLFYPRIDNINHAVQKYQKTVYFV